MEKKCRTRLGSALLALLVLNDIGHSENSPFFL